MLNRKHTTESIEKMRQAKIGKKFSESHKKNMSLALMGHKAWNKGIPERPEITIKKSEKMKAYYAELLQTKWGGLNAQERKAGRKKPPTCEVCEGGGLICYDHDHATGKFRGWICKGCNNTLGFARDNIEVLYKLINYLNQSRGLVVINQSELNSNEHSKVKTNDKRACK